MTATTATVPPRIVSLDFLRGIAVMGILAMNIIAFSMPFQTMLNPTAHGWDGAADLWAWILAFIFVEGKMRAIFSLLFGASMLLVIDRAQAAGRSGGRTHYARMFWLLLFGLGHFFLIWYGDILVSYALTGMVAYLFTRKTPRALMAWAIGLFVFGVLMFAAIFLSPLALEAAASAPNADPAVVAQWQELKGELGASSQVQIAENIAVYQGSYADIVRHTFAEQRSFLIQGVLMFGPETLALMLLGMWGLRSGFLTGSWESRRYLRIAIVCLAISIPVYALSAWAAIGSDFAVTTVLATQVPSAMVRPVMAVGYVAMIVLIAKSGVGGWLGTRIAAAGRAAFTNYLGTSIVATFIFYGWGLGLYGTLGRAESYLVVLGIWVLMLLWSKPWLERFQYGPFEWLWRSLARGRLQPMRRPALPAAA